MPLNLQNVSILGYNQNSQFFGEAFRYQNQKSLSIEGFVRDIGNTSGVVGILSGIENLFSNDEDYQSISINGYNFGNGKILNINFSEGNDVRLKKYSANVVCYETGNLFNLTGLYYSGLSQSSSQRYDLINSLSEDFNYNRDSESYGYSHSVSLKLNSGFGVIDSPITLAKKFASGLLLNNVPFGLFISGENQQLGFKTYSESYNKITNECNFSENYARPLNNSGVLITRTNSYELAEDGIATVVENGNIKYGYVDGFAANEVVYSNSSRNGNGIYIAVDTFNGRKRYYLNGNTSGPSCYWNSLWYLDPMDGGTPTNGADALLYPWLETSWEDGGNVNIKLTNLTLQNDQSPTEFNNLSVFTDSIAATAYERCSGLYYKYTDVGSYDLYSGYKTYSKNLNPFGHTAEYTVSYTNDPRQVSGCSWNYVTEINKDGRYYRINENGNIIGHGIPQNHGYYNAKNLFINIKNESYNRIYNFYTNYVQTPLTLKRIEERQVSSQFNGNVEYSFGYSDDPKNNNDENGIRVQEININDTLPTILLNKFEIYNNKEIVQPQENSTLGNRSLSIDLSLTRNHVFSSIKDYAKNKANEYVPDGADVFIDSINYNYSPTSRKFALNVNWVFQQNPITNI